MNRREFLQCAAIIVTGATASQLGFALTQEQQVYLAAAPNYNKGEVNYLSAGQRKVIAAMSDIIIPRTDTPGAIDAGVPRFIELMVADWFTAQERQIFDAGLIALEQDVSARHGVSFDELDSAEQLQIMEAMEEAAADSSWYDMGNLLRDFVSDAPFICQVKELTVFGFFTSEVGSKQVLRYESMPMPMPMKFDGDIPLDPDDSSWAVQIL